MQTQSALHSLLTSEKFIQNPDVNKVKKVLKFPIDLGGVMFDLMTDEAFTSMELNKQAFVIACFLRATQQDEPLLTIGEYCYQNSIPKCCHLALAMKVYGYCKTNKLKMGTKNGGRTYPLSAFGHILSSF